MQTQDYDTLHSIMSDFKWMSVKIQSDKTIYNLCVDIEKAIDHLKAKDFEVHRINLVAKTCKLDIFNVTIRKSL